MTRKTHFQKQKPKLINYRDYRIFSEYRQHILYTLSLLGNEWREVSFESFLSICMETLDKTAPIKRKYGGTNHSPFLNYKIIKTILTEKD